MKAIYFKNNKMIAEGDIIKFKNHNNQTIVGKVKCIREHERMIRIDSAYDLYNPENDYYGYLDFKDLEEIYNSKITKVDEYDITKSAHKILHMITEEDSYCYSKDDKITIQEIYGESISGTILKITEEILSLDTIEGIIDFSYRNIEKVEEEQISEITLNTGSITLINK